jgi:glycerol transport system ATP-binding protein
MNTLAVTVADGKAVGRSGLELPLGRHLAGLGDGPHTLGVRANHLSIGRRGKSDIALDATVELAEISGSETFVHVRNGDLRWVVQEEGVHEHALGQPVRVHLDPARLYAFDRSGHLELAPARPAGGG